MKPSSGSGLDQLDVAYFTASCDDPETNRRYAQALQLDYPILSDPEADVARAFGVVSGNRKVAQRWTFYIGKDGKILFIDKSVRSASHGSDVVAKLRELGIAMR